MVVTSVCVSSILQGDRGFPGERGAPGVAGPTGSRGSPGSAGSDGAKVGVKTQLISGEVLEQFLK